jgi:hypothetical protein
MAQMKKEVPDIFRNAVKPEIGIVMALGSRIRRRFARMGLREDVPELRGYEPRPAVFKK